MTIIRTFWRDTNGATAIEYAMIAGFLSILIVVGVRVIGTNLSTKYFAPIASNLT